MHQMERPLLLPVLAGPFPVDWFPGDGPFPAGKESQQPKETRPAPAQQQKLPLAPTWQLSQLAPARRPVQTASSESDDTVQDANEAVAAPEPAAEDEDEDEDEDADVEDLLDEFDEDEEDNTFSRTPVPRLIARRLKKTDDGNDGFDSPDGEDLSWADVPPPAALTSVLDEFAPLLRNLVALSIESVQEQASQAREAQAASAAAAAEAAMAAAAEAEAAEAEARRRGKQAVSPQLPPDEDTDRSRVGRGSIGSLGNSSSSSGMRPSVDRDLLPPLSLLGVDGKRPSRRAGIASRLRRHVHVFGSSSDAGESSATGAAAGAALAILSPVGLPGSLSGKARSPIAVLSRHEGSSSASTQAARSALQTEDKKLTAMLLSTIRKDHEVKESQTVECISCFDDVSPRESVKVVCHSYCLGCFRKLVENAVENDAQFPPKCCLNEVPAKAVLRHVPDNLGRRYQAKAAEMSVPVSDRFYCPTVDCGVFVPPSHIARSARVARCRSGHESCTLCRQPAHGNGAGPCPEDRDQQMADDLVEAAGWRRCITCGVIIEHREACQHMTCRCGAQFCYVCRAPWRTCDCDMAALDRLKATATERQRAREEQEEREREAAEKADLELQELREALRLVAEFEEAAARARATRRRHLRRRLQQLRTNREQQLRAETSVRYDRLRLALADMNQMHHAAARAGRDSNLADLVKTSAAERSRLRADHAATRATAAAEADAHVAAAEAAWKVDYAARVRLERGLEAAYRAQMEDDLDLWAVTAHLTAADRAALINAAATDYQRTNDERFDVYDAWRVFELAVARHAADEERAVRGELLDRAAQQLRGQQRAARAVLLRRHAAERVWCQAVAAERRRLLDEMEAVEAELGLAGSVTDNDANLLMLLDILGPSSADIDSGAADDDDEEITLVELSARTLFEDSGFVDKLGDTADDTDTGGDSNSDTNEEAAPWCDAMA